MESQIPFESVLSRPLAKGHRDHVRVAHDPKGGLLEMAIEGEGLRWSWEVAEPARPALLVSVHVECSNGWVALPTWIMNGGNDESGFIKGQELVRLSVARDNSLIVRRDVDEQTTFFPIIDVKQVRGTWWFRFTRIS